MTTETRRKAGEPYSIQRGTIETDRWVLTNLEWRPNHIVDFPQYETGVLPLDANGDIIPHRFELIEHGWSDFDAANALILRALEKSWPIWRINDFMIWFAERQRPKPRFL